jgi:hypothetical protein
MAFEHNPEFGNGGIKSRQTLHELLVKNERILYSVTGILLVIVLVLSLRMSGIFSGEPGGLDGCAVNTAGEPVTGTAQVETAQALISADGCFFFAELPPGEHELVIKTSGGSSLSQLVEIISGQAVELGIIVVP